MDDARKLECTIDELKHLIEEMTGAKLQSMDKIDLVGMDSLDQVEMVMAIEEEWGFEIPDEDLTGWQEWTVEDIAKKILERKGI